MNNKDILWTVVSHIKELSEITATNEDIKIEPENCNIEPRLFAPTIYKLHKDYQVIKLVLRYTREMTFAHMNSPLAETETRYDESGSLITDHFITADTDGYELRLLPEFNKLYSKLLKEHNKTHNQKEIKPEYIVYEIKFDDYTRQLSINNILLSTPDFDKNGHKLIRYLFQHQNEKLKTATVIKEANLDNTREISGILRDLKFTGNLKKLFINSSKQSLQFLNPITQEMLDKSNLKILSIKDFKKQK